MTVTEITPAALDLRDAKAGTGIQAGSWIDGYQAVSPAPVEYIQGDRTRSIDGHTVKGSWSDPWWMYDPDRGWAIARRWRNKAQRVFAWSPERHLADFPAREEREVTPWTPQVSGNTEDAARETGNADGLAKGAGDMGVIHAARVVARAAEASQRAQAEAPQAPERDPLADALAAEIGGPGRIVPGEQSEGEDFTPGDLKFVLDESAEFVAKHVSCTPAQADVMTLYATATHALKAFPTFGRMLFAGETEACGKTVAMTVTAALSANPLDASGTSYALQSALAAASNAPEQLTPTLYYDEISGVFGRSGLAASRDPIAEILRKGYKQGATRAWSVNRTSEQYSVYTPFLMAGLRNAVPRDIRTRCIVVIMRAGTPGAYFDAREAEPEAQALAACLGQAVASCIIEIAGFRAKGIHPQLRDRHLEVWESLFAVAYILGGQEWLNRCLAAFRELALAGSAQVALTPKQKTVKDIAEVTAASDRKFVLEDGTGFMGGKILRAELLDMDDRRPVKDQRYRGRSEASVGQLIADALPMASLQITVAEGKRRWGYYADDIAAAWERIRPDDPEDAMIPEETDPFADEDDELEVHEGGGDSRRPAHGGHGARRFTGISADGTY